MKRCMSFDIGGTYIKYALIDEEGVMSERGSIATPKENCRVAIIDEICGITKAYKLKHDIAGVGVSTAGLVDTRSGVLIHMHSSMPDYSGAMIRDEIMRCTGLWSVVQNDANAAALGELWMGGGKGERSFLCITLGTGVGCGIVINSDIYTGASGFAGEAGHMILNENGLECTCGGFGCYERYASTSALVRRYGDEVDSGGAYESIEGRDIIERVRKGETLAVKLFGEFIGHIVSGLLSLTYILDPGLILIGGGISNEGDLLVASIRKSFHEKCQPDFSKRTRISRAELGNDAGMYGAAYKVLAASESK